MLPAATDSHKMLFKFGLIYLSLFSYANASFPYYGTKIGSLKRLHHGVSGDVYAVDSRTIFVKKFNYDGEAPAAYFYVGNTDKPSNDGGVRLRDERGGTASLTRRYRNKDITLTLPEGKTLRDIKWFSVWCDEFAVNFGDVSIPNNLDFPRPQKIDGLTGVHGVKSDSIVIVDAQTLLVPNFSYDGEAPDAKFWVGQGDRPTPNGLRIPDENGKENPLRRYDRKTIVLTLPDDLTVFDIGHFGVWCEAFTVDFGHVLVPPNVNVPPSLKMLGISPQSKLNCEVLYDDLAFEVRWAVAGESIVVQLVAKLDNNEYMSFGVSPDKDRSVMIGADVVVAWVDQESGKGYAQDYYLEDKSQCSGKHGSCPDVNISENSNSVRLLNAAMVNGYSIVTYQRSLNATDKLDLPISTNGPEAIVWAIGPLNERKETSFHTQYTKHTHYIDFGRQPTWNCPMPEGTTGETENENLEELDNENENDDNEDEDEESGYPPATKPTTQDALLEEEEFYDNRAQALQGNRRQDVNNNSTKLAQRRPVPTPKPVQNAVAAWDIPPIQCFEPDDGVFYAQMGPTGGKHGYSAITGHVGWGISWYINGLLIPEIHVVRGKTYTFVVEGGNNPDIPAKYHPFYITDDPIGGYEHKSEEEKKNIRIFAGVQRSRSGQMVPTGVGRLCNWTPDIDGPAADDYQSFGAYQRTLTLKCDPGDPGVITWKPDRNTPETVYYHCFTHRYLGWKIHVHDTCDDMRFAASNNYAVSVPAATANREDSDSDASIRYENKVSLNDNFLLKHQTDLIKNHNMNGTPPKLAFELNKSTEITKLISDGIRAAEALEESLLKQSNQPLNEPKPQQQPDASNKTQSNASAISSTLPNGKETTSVSQQQYNSYPQQAGPDLFKGESKLHQFPYNLISAPNTQTYNNKAPLPLPLPPQSSPIPTSQYHLAHLTHLHKYHQQHPHNYNHPTINNLTANLPSLPNSQKTISLSEFLRPPFNAPLFHPVKLPGRRPFPGPGPVKKVPASKPILPQQMPRHPPKPVLPAANGPLSQSSVIVNHYRKPVPSLLRPFMKDKPFPLQPLAASVLLLGQPTELINHRKSEPHIHMKQKPIIPVPYGDLLSQGSLQKPIHHFNTLEKLKKPYHPVKLSHPLLGESIKPVQVMSLSTTTSKAVVEGGLSAEVLKKLFDKADVKDEPSLAEIATMKPAVNEGFKPDTVVVESGFRPILREDGPMPPPEVIEQIASRRDDPGAEIDEVMEAGPLFLAAPKDTQTHNFEPMFIPSPPDSTNASIIVRKSTAGALLDKSASQTQSAARPQYQILSSLLKSTKPDSSQLQNATLEDILLGDSKEENDIVREDSYWDDSGEVMKDSAESFGKDQDKGNSIFVEEYKESVKPVALESKDPISSNKTIQKLNLLTTIPSISANRSSSPTEETGSLKNVKNDNIVTLGTDREQSEEDIYEDQQNIDLENNYDDDYEAEVQASERIDSFYLPPDNRKPPSSKPPSGTVVTFDGKPLEDSSLVLPPKLESSSSQSRSFGGVSKLEQLIKTTPQFRPFRGEIPPLGIDSVSSVYNAHSSPSILLASSVQHHKTTKLQALHNGRV